MSIIRRGITGFAAQATVDFCVFQHAVQETARACRAKVLGVTRNDQVTPNFHWIDVQHWDRTFTVLCNRHFLVVAIVKYPLAMGELRPLDLPVFAGPLRNDGLEVASKAELDRRLIDRDLVLLSAAERRQANYWQPKTVCDLVFHWWD